MFKTLRDFDFNNKKVLVRCDFNVPIDENGDILDDFKIKQALPTIKHLIDNDAKIILISHLGEPEGKVVKNLHLTKVAQRLSELLGLPVQKDKDIKPGEVALLGNTRFHKEEYENDLSFAKELAQGCDIFVNEAFSVCHRAHASIARLPEILPSCVGFLLEKEVSNLNKILENPEKPMTAIVGGKKVETKSKFIDKISEIADAVIISGLIKKEIQDKNLQFKYPEKILGPEDNLAGLDINEGSIKIFREKITESKTIIWNGPFGKFEDENYKKGTLAIATAIIESKAFSVVGGGETIEFITKNNLFDKFSFVSTGGGAMLAYLSGEKLPGLVALEK
jgi:3-phosphoglycerate kinase